MSMFVELFALAIESTLTMVMSADEKTGRMTIHVIPKPKKESSEAALSKPLSLTATPAEFDTGFVTALKDFREARQSLAEQAEATCEYLEAAKEAQTKKVGVAVTKAAQSVSTPPQPTATAPKTTQNATAAESASEEFDLFGEA
ncbi:MAG: PRTRC system protein E [Betaproteobacteria bacterium]|nr:PRTRC system protein E [Betaproteobacteria bacterium]